MRSCMKLLILLAAVIVTTGNLQAQKKSEISTVEIIQSVITNGLQHTELDLYAGSLLLHGMTEFGLQKGNDTLLNKLTTIFQKFGTGEIKAKGNFISYMAGGSGAALLAYKNRSVFLDEQVQSAAAKMMQAQKRTTDGLMTAASAKDSLNQVFIDVAFATTPYLLYAGLKSSNKSDIDFAVFETLELFRILRDQKTGLLHQARGFNGAGNLSDDNWSRGNGWGSFALSILVRDLPASHPKRAEVVALAQQFFTSVLHYQNAEGMWRQEMTDPTSYVETSGSGLLLYGLGIMLEKNLLDKKFRQNFIHGLQGYLSYIGSDGSVSHACFSCLAPGKGTKEDYKNQPWVYNDQHAFGPAVLAFAQAAKMGVKTITPLKKLGEYSIYDSPAVPRTYVRFARGTDVAWENDRIGFRVYGPTVRDKVRNGIDIWAKAVAYPVLDKWYKLAEEGKDYHTDRGEGCDFYHMNKMLGCGALAVWVNGQAYSEESFDTYRITTNQDNKIAFELEYKTWNVPNLKLEESKKVEMTMGTNLFKVTSILRSDKDMEMTVAIGLTTYGKALLKKEGKAGCLSVWEEMDSTHGSLGTAVLINPSGFAGFASYKGDELILLKVKTNSPFVYYSGAGWSKSKEARTAADWNQYIAGETKNKFE